MRENRTYGSEGGGTETNRFSLPLSEKRDTYLSSVPNRLETVPDPATLRE